MAKRTANIFVCQNCGTSYPKWQGKCDSCGEWNTIVEEVSQTEGFSKLNSSGSAKKIDFVPLKGDMETYNRLKTGIKEIDRVSGGGLVPGSVILVGGDPGIGKSTLLLQVCAGLAKLSEHYKCCYILSFHHVPSVFLIKHMYFLRDNLLKNCQTLFSFVKFILYY